MDTSCTSCTSPKLTLKQIRPLARQRCSTGKVSRQEARCPGRSRCSSLQLRASADDGKDSFDKSLEEEARLEALERGVKRKQGARAVSAQVRRVESTKATIQNQGGMAPWKEGELFPEGWENMPVTQKIAELYTGKRGLLFWAGKITYALIFAVMGGWIVFRFVLPQLGILELQNGLDSPPNMG